MRHWSMAECAFCDIGASVSATAEADEMDVGAGVVYADDVAIAFLDRSPLFIGHTLVVPRRHVVTMADLPSDLVGPFYRRVQLLVRAMPLATGKPGVFVANNNVVSQSVAHLHVHVVPRERGDGLRGFFWPRTHYQDGELEHTVGLLRGAIAQIDMSTEDPNP